MFFWAYTLQPVFSIPKNIAFAPDFVIAIIDILSYCSSVISMTIGL